ncbi:MAG: hypothetical protein C0417_10320 [Chlorobiaceae bacterium]|nr:hypothetical protein [Chlorobiaceae bacterium]
MDITLSIYDIIAYLNKSDKKKVLDYSYPKPYPENPINTRAILLGCDPSNRHCQDLPFVFAIKSSHNIFNSIVESIKNQLDAVGLSLEMVYCQNLCRNYFKDETSKNSIWEEAAKLWIPVLKKELDEKFAKTVPVLLTAESLY